jgi:hypothetical protein
MFRIGILVFIAAITVNFVSGQTQRISNQNTIGWYNGFLTVPVAKKWSIHAEFQFRRADGLLKGQQNLLRTGINYQADNNLLLRAGYAYIDTYAYGEIPINGMGKSFTEHRAYELLQYSMPVKSVNWTHRWILEQRWVGRYSQPQLQREDQFVFMNRIRYQLRLQKDIFKFKKSSKKIYGAAFDEIMLGFGKNVGENVFDQNRVGLLMGAKLTSKIRFECGYLSQNLQLGRKNNGSNVFQYNNGWIINVLADFRSGK